MTDVWKQCQGQVVDNKFRLQQYLAGTDYSAVFLTQLDDPQPQKAVVKFISTDPATADTQLSIWARVSQLSHPNLLRLFRFGRCRLANRDLLYVVMEYAEEDLSRILPQRPLSSSETREMLEPLLDVLVYLHGKGLVHSHIKPSNILATGDQLKLSSDTVFSIGESRPAQRKPDAYDAPEAATSPLSTSGEVWSLGITLVRALTQHSPDLLTGPQSDPVVPDELPQPFLDIARHALHRDPKHRWTTGDIAARLNPTAIAAAAGHSVTPSTVSSVAVPLSPVPAVPTAKQRAPRLDVPPPRPQPLRQQPASGPKQTLVLPNYVVPLAAGIFVIVALLVLPKILSHRPESSSSASSASTQPASQPKPVSQPTHRETAPPAKPPVQSALKTAPEKKSAAPAPAPATLRTDTFPSANPAKPSTASPARGEVLDQVLPDVSEKARNTIHGTVRVAVRVHVDPAGNVSQAELDSRGPSQYFADQALKAARRWEFTAPEINGHSVPSDWLIRFQFSQSGTKAFPKQTTP